MMRIEDFTQYLLWEKKYSPHTVEAYGTDLSEFEGFLVSMQAPVEDASIDFQAVRAWVVHIRLRRSIARSVPCVRISSICCAGGRSGSLR